MSGTLGLLLLCFVGLTAALWEDNSTQTREESCSCGWTNRGRIVGGKETRVNEYPMIAGVERKSDRLLFCGGTILTPWHVLTAGHCVYPFNSTSEIQLNLGDHDISTTSETKNVIMQVDKMILHEGYVHRPKLNDIALLVTKKEIKFTRTIGPACVPREKMNLVKLVVKVMGWGLLVHRGPSSNTLQHVDLRVISPKKCSLKWENFKEDSMFCTFGHKKDSCQGDSGGPLLWRNSETNRMAIVGLVSYGSICAGPKPGVNTDVSAFVQWINDKIEATKPGTKTCGN